MKSSLITGRVLVLCGGGEWVWPLQPMTEVRMCQGAHRASEGMADVTKKYIQRKTCIIITLVWKQEWIRAGFLPTSAPRRKAWGWAPPLSRPYKMNKQSHVDTMTQSWWFQPVAGGVACWGWEDHGLYKKQKKKHTVLLTLFKKVGRVCCISTITAEGSWPISPSLWTSFTAEAAQTDAHSCGQILTGLLHTYQYLSSLPQWLSNYCLIDLKLIIISSVAVSVSRKHW